MCATSVFQLEKGSREVYNYSTAQIVYVKEIALSWGQRLVVMVAVSRKDEYHYGTSECDKCYGVCHVGINLWPGAEKHADADTHDAHTRHNIEYDMRQFGLDNKVDLFFLFD